VNHLLGERRQAHELKIQRLPPDLGKVEQFIHQQSHASRSLVDSCQVLLRLGLEPGLEIFFQYLGKADDMPQWGPQIVGNGVSEGL